MRGVSGGTSVKLSGAARLGGVSFLAFLGGEAPWVLSATDLRGVIEGSGRGGEEVLEKSADFRKALLFVNDGDNIGSDDMITAKNGKGEMHSEFQKGNKKFSDVADAS